MKARNYFLLFFLFGLCLTPYLSQNVFATSLSLKVPPRTTAHEIMPYCDTLCELDSKSSIGIIDNGLLQTGKRKVTCACG